MKKLNEDVIARLAVWKLLDTMSCVGCKFMYFERGYSNYDTVENTDVICALSKNPNLPADIPYDWNPSYNGHDNWPKTCTSRCEKYEQLPEGHRPIQLDVDGEDPVESQTTDPEIIEAINKSM